MSALGHEGTSAGQTPWSATDFLEGDGGRDKLIEDLTAIQVKDCCAAAGVNPEVASILIDRQKHLRTALKEWLPSEKIIENL